MFNTEGCIQFYSWEAVQDLVVENQRVIDSKSADQWVPKLSYYQKYQAQTANQDRYNQSILPTEKEI